MVTAPEPVTESSLTAGGLARQWRAEADAHWTGSHYPRSDLDLERRGYAEALRDCASELEAAAPLIAAAERERCAQLAESVCAIYPLPRPVPAVTVNGEPVPTTAGNVVAWPDGMPAIGLVGCLLREQP